MFYRRLNFGKAKSGRWGEILRNPLTDRLLVYCFWGRQIVPKIYRSCVRWASPVGPAECYSGMIDLAFWIVGDDHNPRAKKSAPSTREDPNPMRARILKR